MLADSAAEAEEGEGSGVTMPSRGVETPTSASEPPLASPVPALDRSDPPEAEDEEAGEGEEDELLAMLHRGPAAATAVRAEQERARAASLAPEQATGERTTRRRDTFEAKRLRSLFWSEKQTSPLLELPAELLRVIVSALILPDRSEPAHLDLRLLDPYFPPNHSQAFVLEAMRGHGANLGGVRSASALACVCSALTVAVPDAAVHSALGTTQRAVARAVESANEMVGFIPPMVYLNREAVGARECVSPMIMAHLGELETRHFQFLESQSWAELKEAVVPAVTNDGLACIEDSSSADDAWCVRPDHPCAAQLLAFLRSRAARWDTLRRSLWTMRLPMPLRLECCRTYPPPKWPKCLEVNLPMRQILIDWLIDVAASFVPRDGEFSDGGHWPEQLVHLAITLLDHYMAAAGRSVPRSQLQLVGCGALFCAVMYEANPAVLPEGEAPWTRVVTARRLAELTDDTYTGEQVVEMSEAMLSSARIPSLTELTTATAFGFVTALTTPAPPAYPMNELFRTLESYAYFFVDLSLVWSPFILGEQHSDGATVGAASLLLAAYLHECVQPPLVELLQASIRAPVGSLEPCVQWLAGLVAQEMAKMATGKEVVLKTDKLTAVLQKHIDTAQDISTLPRARSEEHDEEEAEVPLDARLMPLRLLTIDWVLHAPPSSRAYLPLAHIPAAEQSAWERAEQVLQREAGTRSAAALSGVAARERDDPDEEDAAEDAEGVDAEKSEV